MYEVKPQRILLWAAGIFLLAFGLRFFHITEILQNSPFFDVFPGDLGAYDRWASKIPEQGWSGREIFYQDPLYPYFLAIIYKVIGRDFFWIYTIQALFGAATAMLVFLLGNRIFGKAAGIIGGLFYSCYGPAIYFDSLLLKVSVATFLFTLSIYYLINGCFKESLPGILLSGLLLGLASLARGNFLLLLPVIFMLLLLSRQVPYRKRVAAAALFLAGSLMILAPVAARNYVVGGNLVLTTSQAGQNFFIGQNPKANGTYIKLSFVRPDPVFEQEDFHKEAEKRLGRELTSSEVSRYWFGEGLNFISKNPISFLKLTGRKLLLFFNNYEIPDNHNFYFHQRFSKIIAYMPVTFGLISPFFIIGMLGMIFERRTGSFFLFIIQIGYICSVILFYVFSRYRLPVLPLFCVAAGYGVVLLYKQIVMQRWKRLAFSLLLVGIAVVVSSHQLIKPFDFSHSFTDQAIAHEMREEEAKALASYHEALLIRPNYERALVRLGSLQIKQKDYDGARQTFQRMLKTNPDSVEAKYQLMWLDKMGL
jgi:4-amino-4-deoxy-L-arabinose transferase-like glycosyltransferase